MRISRLTLLIPLLASSVAAQRRPLPRRASDLLLQTVTVDVASAFQQHYRAMIEPLVFGRFTVGLSGEYTSEPDDSGYDVTVFEGNGCSVYDLCSNQTPYYDSRGTGYRAWSFNLHGRWYPRALSHSGPRQSVAAYVGEFIGFHERRTSQPVYYGYGCPTCAVDPPRPDSSGISSPPVPCCGGGSSVYTQVVHGWEPGAEFGIRVLPMHHVVMDIGGRFRLARIEDYQSGTRPGGVDSRLVVAIGVGW